MNEKERAGPIHYWCPVCGPLAAVRMKPTETPSLHSCDLCHNLATITITPNPMFDELTEVWENEQGIKDSADPGSPPDVGFDEGSSGKRKRRDKG